ncbi:hypothetical protein [Kineosporia sp. A_224]|uniref:hypothetical protein n=1 Tax=Kineosporia sp. A_224 TaxID=1962180 RepID=UPI00117B4D6C|nr:hypothetical protein [Kineosporia sp. A_224]
MPRLADRRGVVRRRPARTAAALALTVTGLALAGLGTGAAPASAADGGLTFVPGKATIGTPIYAVTSAGCPKEATNVVGYIFGQGFPKAGKIVVPNQDAPVRHDGSFGVALQDNLRNFAKEEGIKRLSGPYRVEVRCSDQFLTKTSATFSGTVTVTDGENFTAPVPKKPPVAGVPDLMLAQVFPAYAAAVKAQGDARNAELAAEQGRATASPAPKALETLAAPQKSVQEAAARRPATVGSAFTVPVLVLLVVAALSGAVWLWTRGGQPDAGTRTRGAAAVTWPDDDRPRTGAGRADRR